MKLPKSPLFLPVMLFVLGAVLSSVISYSFDEIVKFGIVFFCLCLITQFLKRQKRIQSLFVYSCYFWVGLIYFKGYYSPSKNHFQNFLKDETALKKIVLMNRLGSNSFSNTYTGKIIQWGEHPTEGKVLVQQERKSDSKPWSIGQKILTNQKVQPLKERRNPGEFSFKDYLNTKKIEGQLNLHSENSLLLPKSTKTFRSKSWDLKQKTFKKIENSRLSSESQAMLKALLFAERNALEEGIIKDYAKAGVIHLLALSGLHIGLFVGLLMWILLPLKKIKYGSLVRTLLIICVLWGFDFFIGFPASVTRAVTMFSFMVVGRSLHYGKHTFHYTVLSLFVLLICYPPYLKSIGFQLSYLAVFGILLIHPLLQQFWKPKTWIVKKYWEWTTVCLAAQMAVGPISIYYFHQFPSLFLFSNLLIIPFFGLFLLFSMIVLCFILFFLVPEFIGVLFDQSVRLLNATIGGIANQEKFLFEELFHSLQTTVLLYCLLIVLVLWGYKKAFWQLTSIGVVLLVLLLHLTFEQKNAASENSFWIFNNYRASLMGHQKGSQFFYYSSHSQNTQSILTDFVQSRKISKKIPIELENIYVYQQFKLLILNDHRAYHVPSFEPQYILLRNNPKVNIERLLSHYKPQLLVADGTNAPWNILLWRKSCLQKGVEFHSTRTDGALKISL
jgi:competence protein ComEC